MKVGFGCVVITAGLMGILSFSFLAFAIGTEYWYVIDDNRQNHTDPEHFHSGLWGGNDGMHNVIAILLPLSLVMLVFGGICGVVSSLAQSKTLLIGTASCFLVCSLLTLSGVSLYISYSQQALEETERRIGPEQMALVHTSFGWSMGMAWLSFILEVITGLLLLFAARIAQLTQYQETGAPI